MSSARRQHHQRGGTSSSSSSHRPGLYGVRYPGRFLEEDRDCYGNEHIHSSFGGGYSSSSSTDDDDDERVREWARCAKKRRMDDADDGGGGGIRYRSDRSSIISGGTGITATIRNCSEEGVEEYQSLLPQDDDRRVIILHLDIDYFYCQSQILRRFPHLADKPVAIQQKHIIVTCNYVARSRGVSKLMLLTKARQNCGSDLVVIDGSDLTLFRKESRIVYDCFRSGLDLERRRILLLQKQRRRRVALMAGGEDDEDGVGKESSWRSATTGGVSPPPPASEQHVAIRPLRVAAKKGGMDEMFADVTYLVVAADDDDDDDPHDVNDDHRKREREEDDGTHSGDDDADAARTSRRGGGVFVYGDGGVGKQCVTIKEDQSGTEVRIITGSSRNSKRGRSGGTQHHDGSHYHDDLYLPNEAVWSSVTPTDVQRCSERLLRRASVLAQRIQRRVRDETGYTTSVGVSVSPMLAKIASGMKKPNSVNILYPWRSHELILPMPLRKVPDLGRRTLQSMEGCLQQYAGNKKTKEREGDKEEEGRGSSSDHQEYWTCRDLLKVPYHVLASQLKGSSSHNADMAQVFLDRCRGIDRTKIEDDGGGLSKTVSVEDSHRRGSVVTYDAVADALNTLCHRLPSLLRERRVSSDRPELAYPCTLRVTLRNLPPGENSLAKRRSTTKSKQAQFNGKRLSLVLDDDGDSSRILRSAATPLLKALLDDVSLSPEGRVPLDVTRLNLAAANFVDVQNNALSREASSSGTAPVGTGGMSGDHRSLTAFFSPSRGRPKLEMAALAQAKVDPPVISVRTARNNSRNEKTESDSGNAINASAYSLLQPSTMASTCGIDPDVLDELPPDIRAEVLRDFGRIGGVGDHQMHSCAAAKKKSKGGGGSIERYFVKVKK